MKRRTEQRRGDDCTPYVVDGRDSPSSPCREEILPSRRLNLIWCIPENHHAVQSIPRIQGCPTIESTRSTAGQIGGLTSWRPAVAYSTASGTAYLLSQPLTTYIQRGSLLVSASPAMVIQTRRSVLFRGIERVAVLGYVWLLMGCLSVMRC